jgi:hypothetical protein
MEGFRFGKHPPKIDYRTLRLRDYLTPALPPPPPSVDVVGRVTAATNQAVTALFPMDGNDQYGDCTIAALAHADTLYQALVKKNPKILPQKAVVKLYLHLTGGVDSGLNELDVLNYWQSNAVEGDKIAAFVSIDPKNHAHVQQALALFNGVYLGFQVQANCIADFNAHKPWTPGTLTNDGHAVFAVGYDASGVTVLTWGNSQQGTWAWWDECVDEAYAILPPEALVAGFSPGFNSTQLHDDLQAVAN